MDCDFCERKTGVEPATFSLEGWRSTNWATSAFFIVGNFTFAKVKIIFISCKYFLYFFFKKSGESRIRTYEAEATELQSVPFSHSGISPNFFKRASRGIRTHDPEITNHVLWPTELWRHILKELLSVFLLCKDIKVFQYHQIFFQKKWKIFNLFFFFLD